MIYLLKMVMFHGFLYVTFKQQQHPSRFSFWHLHGDTATGPGKQSDHQGGSPGRIPRKELGMSDLSGKIDTINNSSGIGISYEDLHGFTRIY